MASSGSSEAYFICSIFFLINTNTNNLFYFVRVDQRSFAAVGVDPAVMGIGPSAAIPPAVKSAGLELNDINLYEINEVHDFIAEDFLVKPEQAKYFNLFFFFFAGLCFSIRVLL